MSLPTGLFGWLLRGFLAPIWLGADTTVKYLDSDGTVRLEDIDRNSGIDVFYVKERCFDGLTAVRQQLARTETFTTASNGTTQNIAAQGMAKFSLQVTKTGSVTSWTVVLEYSLDGTTFTTALTHTDVSPGNGLTQPCGAAMYPALYWRLRCSAITLGAGTNVVAIGVALP